MLTRHLARLDTSAYLGPRSPGPAPALGTAACRARGTTRPTRRVPQVLQGAARTFDGRWCPVPGSVRVRRRHGPARLRRRGQRARHSGPAHPWLRPTGGRGQLAPGFLPDRGRWETRSPLRAHQGCRFAVPNAPAPGDSPHPPGPAAPPASAFASGPALESPFCPQDRVRKLLIEPEAVATPTPPRPRPLPHVSQGSQ